MNTEKPSFVLICGSNGAGKSTFTSLTRTVRPDIFIIDPDKIAKDNHCSPMQAGRMTLMQTEECLRNKITFLKESTLSSQSDLKLIEKARCQGFFVSMLYIGLNNFETAIERVACRFQNGGHTVPEEDIQRRYIRSLENLPKAIKLLDEIEIYNNSDTIFQKVAIFQNGQLFRQFTSPDWFKPIEKELGIEFHQEPQKIFLDVPRMEEETKELNKLGTK